MAAVTIKEIAQQLNVSPATVSLALNGRPGVNAQTRENVLKLVQKLNYTGNTAGNKSVKKRSKRNLGTIGFLVYKRYGKIITDSQFFTALISAVERAARAQDYTIMLLYCMGEEEINDSLKLLQESNLTGMLILGTELSETDVLSFYDMSLPAVILDCDIRGCKLDTVTIHNEDGIWRGMKYLYEQGHRDIGYFRSSFSIRNFEQRLLGYEECLEHFNINKDKQKIFLLEPTIDGSFSDVCELINQNITFPSAIIADNDLIALGAMKAFAQYGINVPNDISIIGFDDISMASFIEPQLTSIYVSCESLGESAIEQLLWRKEHLEATPRRLSVTTELNIRSSVLSYQN